MLDGGEADDKIIAVAEGDPSVNHIKDISELPAHFLIELRNFFESYTKLENKKVIIEEFMDSKKAVEIVNESFNLYNNTFRNRGL
jgi:inorganic pyrophosphatase